MIKLKNVSFTYADAPNKALNDLTVSIPKGSFVAIVGDNGAGKSTFCKLLNGIIPHFIDGDLTGAIFLEGEEIRQKSPATIAKKIGYVYQDFENQIIRPKVLDDASYGLLNEGEKNYEAMTLEVLATLDLAHLADEYVWQLSGGQKHLLALAGVLVMAPEIIVLDEPVAQLDPFHANKIYENLAYLNQKLGKTILVIEHNSEFIGRYCDSVLLMKEKQISWFLPTKMALQKVEELINAGVYPPQVTLLAHEMIKKGHQKSQLLPINQTEALDFMSGVSLYSSSPSKSTLDQSKRRMPFIEFKKMTITYPRINEQPKKVIDQLDLTIRQGEKIAIIGNNGAGKSSLMKLCVGLIKPTQGQMILDQLDGLQMKTEEIAERIGYVYQNAENMFIEDSIEKDIAFSLKARGVKDYKKRTQRLLEQFDLIEIRNRDGRLLSGGQMRRASLAIGISLEPTCLLLDEPTASLDLATRKKITQTLKSLTTAIETIVIATHDMQLVCEWAERIIVMNNGQIVGDGTREEVFNDPILLKQAGIQIPELVALSRKLGSDAIFSIPQWMDCLEEVK